ncbi:MAG TPA: PQQ-binding-like beta-propeller repeat protein [Planctomycetota bacterium]
MQTISRTGRSGSRSRHLPRAAAGAFAVALAGTASAQWPQWGGPARDFHAPDTELAEEWPESGPRKLWERELGAGYSSLVADGGRLFTMYRGGEDEVVVSLDAASGATVWEHRTPATSGAPPNSTPTVAGERVYTLGFEGRLSALERASGKLVWSHDLVAEHGAQSPQFGFAASPLVHGEALLLPLGGAGRGVAAFALADGKLLWLAQDVEEAYASPVLIEVDGEAQVAVLAAGRVIGLSPKTGELLWSEPVGSEQNIVSPIWSPHGLMCVTGSGSCLLRFSRVDGKTRVERVWENDQLRIAQTTVVLHGEHFYGSTGEDPYLVTAIHTGTGEVAWREPGFSLANVVSAGGKLLLLDYDGALGLATPGPGPWTVDFKVALLQPQAFTPPSVAGNHAYLRDLHKVMALDLGQAD